MDAVQVRAARALAWYYRRNGYVRRQDAGRLASEGPQQYKKGEEVRLVARTAAELRVVRRLLREAGFKPGRPFLKGRQYRQPVYGREAVARFLEVVESERDA
jgi:hypothetical protein